MELGTLIPDVLLRAESGYQAGHDSKFRFAQIPSWLVLASERFKSHNQVSCRPH
jgi:hypothetical protein